MSKDSPSREEREERKNKQLAYTAKYVLQINK